MKLNNKIWIYALFLIIISGLGTALQSNITVNASVQTSIGFDTGPWGSQIRFNGTGTNYYIYAINFSTAVTGVNSGYIINSSGVVLERTTNIIGNIAYFTGTTMIANGTNVTIAVNGTNRAWFAADSPGTYPRKFNDVNWINAIGYNVATGAVAGTNTLRVINVLEVIYDTTPQGYGGIAFQNPTPTNNSAQYYTNNSITINSSVTNVVGTIDTTQTIYYENGTIFQTITNNSMANVTNTFTNLTVGRYYFNATFTNGTLTNSTDTRIITIYNITPGTINIPSNNTNITRYLNISWNNSTTTNNSVTISSFKIYLNNTLINTTSTLNITNYDTYYNNFSIGEYRITIETTDINNNKQNSTQTVIINHLTSALLNITAVDVNGNLVTTFNTTINGITYTTTTGYMPIDLIKNTNYTVYFNATNYAYTSRSITLQNYTQTLNFTAYPEASLLINIYDEMTGYLINQTVTVTVTDITNPNIVTSATSNGTILVQNLYTNDLLEVRFNSTNYTNSRNYQIILPNSYGSLNAYLLPKASAENFSICWYNTNGVPINGLHVYQWFLTSGQYALTQDVYSDINGRTSFVFTDTHYYLYNISSTIYGNSPFILNPPDNTNTLSSGCNYDVTLSFSETVPTYNTANVTGTATFNNNTNILTFTYTSYNTSYSNYYYNVTKLVNGVEVVICSDSSSSTTDTFTCDLTGYYDTITVKGYADNQIFYGGYIQINPSAKLFQNLNTKDASYIAGFIMLIIIFAGTFLGIIGTMISGIIGLIIIMWLGLVQPLTITLIIAAIIVTIVINVGLRRYR